MITALVERDPFSFCGGEDSGVRRCKGGLRGHRVLLPPPPALPPLHWQIRLEGGRDE